MADITTNFIVLDLEWNGHPDGKTGQLEAMPFEIIQIGAVKLSSALEVLDRFSSYIRPQVYPKLHYKTKELLGITYKDLKDAKTFPEVIDAFFAWCGSGYRFCTWGSMDLTEIQRNLSYYGIVRYFSKPVLYYNLQQVHMAAYKEPAPRTLEYAVRQLAIPETRPFHDALDDALYTAEVFRRLDPDFVLKHYSIDYYRHPLTKAEEVYLTYEDSSEFISREYPSRDELLRSKNIITLTCPVCGAHLNREVRWFSGNVKNYYCLGCCRQHGYIQGKLHIKRTPEAHYFAVKTSRLIDAAEAHELTLRYEQFSSKKPQNAPHPASLFQKAAGQKQASAVRKKGRT